MPKCIACGLEYEDEKQHLIDHHNLKAEWEEELKKLEIIIEDGVLEGCLVYHESVKNFISELLEQERIKAIESEYKRCNALSDLMNNPPNNN
jgi:hypothetical protein